MSTAIRACRRDTSRTPEAALAELRYSRSRDDDLARRTRAALLETRTSRLRLGIAKKPVFVKIGPGIGLGYRRNQTAGTWVLRVANGKRGNWTRAIAAADDFADADGNMVLDFWQAQDRARALARAKGDGDSPDDLPITVSQALDRYKADLTTRGGDTGNVERIRIHLSATLLTKDVALLPSRDLRKWRDNLVTKLAPATVNRTAAAFKAALNLAADHDDRIANRHAWGTGLASIPDAEHSRNVILPENTIRLIIAAAYRDSLEFGLLIEVAAVTGARVSQLANLETVDLQGERSDPRLMMPTSRKGTGTKKIGRRPVPIPSPLAVKLHDLATGRPSSAPLLIKPDQNFGKNGIEPSPAPSYRRWKKSDHSRLFARAVRAAGLDPAKVTMYALRHSNIVRQILAGVPLRVVAVNHDTSVGMLERTYSRYIGDHADALARVALLDTTATPDRNVVPMTSRM
jgi:integrase